MDWWIIALIAAAAVLLILTAVVNIELCLYIAPNSFWTRHLLHWDEPEVKGENLPEPLKVRKANHEKIKAEVVPWLERDISEEWFTEAFDGIKLRAAVFKQKAESHKWAVCLHGYGGSSRQAGYYGIQYFKKGYNVVIPDLRYFGGSKARFVGMGWLDRKDMLKWIEKITEADTGAEIVFHGESMGAAAIMMMSGEALPENVKCLIADCGYTSVFKQLECTRKNILHAKSFPFLYLGSFCAKVRAGYSFKEASCIKQLKKCKTPVFFIHGAEDKFIPNSMLKENYAAVTDCIKDWYIFPYADHCCSVLHEPELYWEKVFGFVERFIK